MIELSVQDKAGQEVTRRKFETDEISIGRAAGNDLVLASPTVSSKHARLRRENGSWVVADQKSTNGTFVNGVAAEGPVRVKDGDVVQLGEFTIRLMAPVAEDATLIRAAPKKPAPAAE